MSMGLRGDDMKLFGLLLLVLVTEESDVRMEADEVGLLGTVTEISGVGPFSEIR